MANLEKARVAKAAKAAARIAAKPAAPPVKPAAKPAVKPAAPPTIAGVHVTADGKVYASRCIKRAAKRAAVAAGRPYTDWRSFIGSDGPDFDGGPQARFDGMSREEVRAFYAAAKRTTPPAVKAAVATVKATTPKPASKPAASVESVSVKERLDMLESMMLRMFEYLQANAVKA